MWLDELDQVKGNLNFNRKKKSSWSLNPLPLNRNLQVLTGYIQGE
jgi:hypothetical protein